MPPKRPIGVTLLLVLVLCLSAWGSVRFFAAFRWRNELYEFGAQLSPMYLALSGLGWTLGGVAIYWGIIRRNSLARHWVVAAAGLWQLQYWMERVFFQAARPNIGFVLTATLVMLLIVVIAASQTNTIRYLSKSEEHGQADKSPKTS